MATLGALEQLLVDFDGCAITVTHDRYFLNRVATSITSLFKGDCEVIRYADATTTPGRSGHGMTRRRPRERLRGWLRRWQREAKARETEPPPARAKLSYAEQKELDGLMDKVEAADLGRWPIWEGQLADPALYATRGAEVATLTAELAQKRGDAARLLSRWEELETRREAAGKG